MDEQTRADRMFSAADALIEEQARLIASQQESIRLLTTGLSVMTKAISGLETSLHKLKGGMQEP